MSPKEFPSKILLFGEYGNIYGSQFLTFPYGKLWGKLVLPLRPTSKKGASDSNQKLWLFYRYLVKERGEILDLNRLEKDLTQGLFFDSRILEGVGLGSSGALCAALYSEYGSYKEAACGELSLEELRNIFSDLEAYFHKKSSGMDPLVCYTKHPLLMQSTNSIIPVSLRALEDKNQVFFLINSHRVRRTDSLIEIFLKKYQAPLFRSFFKEVVAPLTNDCIQLFLKGYYDALWEPFFELSSHQLEHLQPMIPSNIEPLWRNGLSKKDFALKLCGSGGGGFFWGMARNAQDMEKHLKGYDIRVINRYLGGAL